MWPRVLTLQTAVQINSDQSVGRALMIPERDRTMSPMQSRARVFMRQVAVLLSRLLAISSVSAGLMGLALMGHSVLTPQTHLPRLHDDGPSVAVRFGIGSVCTAVALGLLSYAFAQLGSAAEGHPPR
jgi:hypothetical protein